MIFTWMSTLDALDVVLLRREALRTQHYFSLEAAEAEKTECISPVQLGS